MNYMATDGKKRHVVSYENMNPELARAFAEKYPQGYSDYLNDLREYPKPDGTSFFAVTVEIPDAIYLVKIKIDVDDVEDLQRWLDGDDSSDESVGSSISSEDSSESAPLPDDNISQYGSEEDAD